MNFSTLEESKVPFRVEVPDKRGLSPLVGSSQINTTW